MIRILFSDVDGVLYHEGYTSQQGLSPNTSRLLEIVNSRIPFYICSGRSIENFEKLPNMPYKGAIIEFGAYIKENGTLDDAWQMQFNKHQPQVNLVAEYLEGNHMKVTRSAHTLRLSKANLTETEEIQRNISDFILKQDLDLKAFETTYEVVVIPKGASKEKAVIYLCNKNGYGLNQAAYIGDGKRDIPIMELLFLPMTLASTKPEVIGLVRKRGGFVADKGFAEGIEQILGWFVRGLEENA